MGTTTGDAIGNGRIRTVVEASDPLSVEGLTAALDRAIDVELVDRASDADVAVLAVRTMDHQSLARLDHLHGRHALRVVLVVEDLDEEGLLSAVEHGVSGVLLRRETVAVDLQRAVAMCWDGEGVMSPALLGQLLQAIGRLSAQHLAMHDLALVGLSDRELAVLRLLAQGHDTAEVAVQLNYSVRTIKSTVAQIVSRLSLRNRTQAVAYAVRQGLI